MFLVEVGREAEPFGAGADDAPCSGDGFLHHVAQLAGAHDVAFAFEGDGFDGEQLAAHFRPRQPGYLADAVFVFGHAEVEAAHAEVVVQVARVHDNGFGLAAAVFVRVFGQLRRHHALAADFGDFAVERAHAGFAGVVAHDVAHGRFADVHFAFAHAVALHLFGHEVLHGDADFFVFGVAREADDFHAVEQGGGDVHAVGGGDEQYVAQIVVHFDKVVGEGAVLFGVEHFQQRTGRVATEVVAQLVDFVEQEQRVFHAGFDDALDDFAGH